MLKILLKKQLLEINRGFFYDQKKGKRRSRLLHCHDYRLPSADGRHSRRNVHFPCQPTLHSAGTGRDGLAVLHAVQSGRRGAWRVRQCVQHLCWTVSGQGQRSSAVAAHPGAACPRRADAGRVPDGTDVLRRRADPGDRRVFLHRGADGCVRPRLRAAFGPDNDLRAVSLLPAGLGRGEDQPEAQKPQLCRRFPVACPLRRILLCRLQGADVDPRAG